MPSPSNVSTDAGTGNAPAANLPLTLPAPTIEIEDFSGSVSLKDDRADAELRYTLDGSPPTPTSTLYRDSFFPTCRRASAVITAAAFTSSAASPPANKPFTQHPFIDLVLISPIQAHFAVSGEVTLTCPDATAIYYTTDGSGPTTASTLYTGPITIDHSLKLIVVGVRGPDGCGDPGGAFTTEGSQDYTVGP